jgi:hypothetical protein
VQSRRLVAPCALVVKVTDKDIVLLDIGFQEKVYLTAVLEKLRHTRVTAWGIWGLVSCINAGPS